MVVPHKFTLLANPLCLRHRYCIHPHVRRFWVSGTSCLQLDRLSWADTAASTCGRLWGRYTPPLPQRLPFLRLPLAPRKSLAGFIAASVTGALVAIGFWRFVAPIRLAAPGDISWSFNGGFNLTTNDAMGAVIQDAGVTGIKAGGWLGLGLIGLTAGVVSGVAEALGQEFLSIFTPYSDHSLDLQTSALGTIT
jgi:hypothetical protein